VRPKTTFYNLCVVQVVLMRLRSEVEEAGNLTERYTNHINTVAEAALRNTHLLKVGLYSL
jgi:hypothetical protein